MWESESFLAIAKTYKNVEGNDWRVKNLSSFYEATERYSYFHQWQKNKFDKAKICSLSEEKECTIDFIATCKSLSGIEIKKDQEVHMIHSEWNLLDILWEDKACWYRVMWCMTC